MTLRWPFRRRALLQARFHQSRRRARVCPLRQLEQLEDRCVLSTLTVNGSQHLQTIDGFGSNLSSEAWNGGAVTPSLDILLNHGYKIFRVIVEPVQGWEDTNPNTGQYSASNPNWGFYNNLYGTSSKFTNLWNTVSYLNNHGATVWVNLQSDAPAWMTDAGGSTGSMGPDHEADWATMVTTMVNYAVNTAHVHIDALGPMNEPNNPGDPVQGPQVNPTQYVRMMDTLETQLQGYGLGSIPLVGPDTSAGSTSYDPAILADSFLMPHIFQFGFHAYAVGPPTDPAITTNATYPGRHIIVDEYDGTYFAEDSGQRATPSELWAQADGSFANLIQDIQAGENGAVIWDGVDNFYLYYNKWSAHGLISYDWTASNPTAQSDYGTTPRLYANAQVFQFVAPGSVVIGSSSNSGSLPVVAFRNPSGQITIAGENTGASSQTVTGTLTGGLNVSLFNVYFTNSSLNEQQQANVAVTNNTFTFTVPADTIFTLTTPTAPLVTGVTPISGLTGGGQSVTITGSNFSGATAVAFGGVPAGSFTINSDTKITALTPAHGVGTVDVTVAMPNGSSAISAADQFQFVAVNGTDPPTVATAANAVLASNQASASLSVLGSSQYAANTLTYTWTTTGTPPAPVTFSTNGNNSASNVTAVFSKAGTYSFQVTITDPAGNTATSRVDVIVNQVPTVLTVSPSNGSVVPGGTLQFSATASDQFGSPYTATPISWAVSGGGKIDTTGKFTAGSSNGGPFTVTASAGGLNATASVTISSNVNIAPNGTAYRWSGLGSATANTSRTAAPGLNDNNLSINVALAGGADDVANAYEAAGVLWSNSQSVNKVTFTNGSFNASSYDGVFDKNFGLQMTTDGTTWTPVSGWSVSPAYQYNLAAAAGVTYTFTGPTLSALGIRVVGQVHSVSGNDSWYANATEVQAFGAVSNPLPTVSGVNPNSGGLAGGTSVIITGSNFTGATGVSFGSVAASSFTVNSATQITAVDPAASAAGSVDVTVTTANGTSATSAADRFTYVSPPSITTQPASQTVNAGQSASFTVTATGAGALTYQWQKFINSAWSNISGATSGTYTIAAAATSDAGSYDVIVSNAGGSVTSNAATLTVTVSPPAAPTGLTAGAGSNQVSLSWSASSGASSYRVYRGTSSGSETLFATPTGTGTTYVDSTASNGSTYYYQVTALNSGGESPPSTEVSATPQVPVPTVTGLAPKSGALAGGTSVIITGSNFTGATGVSFGSVAASSFTVNSATQITAVAPAAGAGSVDVTVTTANGTSATSAADLFTYVAPPGITTQPTNQTANVGQPASFTVAGSGAGTLTYQWQKLVNSTWTNISGATSATYTIAAAATSDAGSYDVIVSNAGGSVTSDAATLTVIVPAPPAPTGLTATPGNNQVSLSWSASSGAAGYRIYRGTSAGSETLLASPTGTGTNYVDSTAANGTKYYYQVTAVNSGGESPRSTEVSATPQAMAVNIAVNGTAYRWWNLTTATSNANRAAASGLNDNNLTNAVVLSGSGINGQGDDNKNAYEAAGILWSTPQTITQVKFTNGSFTSSFDGVFDANFGLQYTTDGVTWLPVSGWTVTPNYAYNSSSAANVTYTFSGPALTVLGVRVVGQVHTSDTGNNSWYARATEVQVFGG